MDRLEVATLKEVCRDIFYAGYEHTGSENLDAVFDSIWEEKKDFLVQCPACGYITTPSFHCERCGNNWGICY